MGKLLQVLECLSDIFEFDSTKENGSMKRGVLTKFRASTVTLAIYQNYLGLYIP